MNEIVVLVTGVGSTTGVSVIKGLRNQEEFQVKVIGTDINAPDMLAGSSFCDAFYSVPQAIDEDYIPALIDICKKENVKVLIPIVDSELLVLSNEKEPFKQIGVHIVVSSPDTVRTCNDKYATFQFFNRHGIPTPKTWLIDEINDPVFLDYPIFVKPRYGVSSIDAFRIDSPDELMWTRKRVPNLIVQEFLEGDEYTTDVLADFSNGVIAVVPRQRLETKAGISYKGRTCQDDRLIRWGYEIIKALNIHGPANIQCMVSIEKIAYFEVNPRFSGSLPLTIAAGVNSPLWILKLTCGERAPQKLLPFQSIIMTRYWSEVFRPCK